MACSFYNFNYKGSDIPLKTTYHCGKCPHNKNNFCSWFEKKLVENNRKFYDFDLVFYDDIISTQPFYNMDDALKALRGQCDELIPGFYTIVNKETGEVASMTVLKVDIKNNLPDEEIKKRVENVISKLDLNLDMGMLDVKIERQAICHGCIYNERGYCLTFGGRPLIEAKKLCYKRGDNDEKC